MKFQHFNNVLSFKKQPPLNKPIFPEKKDLDDGLLSRVASENSSSSKLVDSIIRKLNGPPQKDGSWENKKPLGAKCDPP